MRGWIHTPLIVLLVLLQSNPVMAYLDPGSGSGLLTVIIGAFVALGLTIKSYWYKLKSLFTGKKAKPQPVDEPDSSDSSR